MDIVFILLPAALILAGLGVAAFVWAVKRGQFDDLDTPPLRMLFSDDEEQSSQGKEIHGDEETEP